MASTPTLAAPGGLVPVPILSSIPAVTFASSHHSPRSKVPRRRQLPTPLGVNALPIPPTIPPLTSLGRLDAVKAKFINFVGSQKKKPVEPASHASAVGMLNNEQVPRAQKPNIKEEDVMKCVLEHKDFKVPSNIRRDIAPKDLPAFDHLEHYGVTDDQSRELWEREVRRLVRYANNREEELQFSDDTLFKDDSGSPRAYRCLANLADRILDCDRIRRHDNEFLLLKHCKDLHVSQAYERDRRFLCRFETGSMDDEMTDEESRTAIFCLVDYTTAVFARFFIQAAYSDEWAQNCLAILATWSTAIKIISEKPAAFSTVSLDRTEEKTESDNSKRKLPEVVGGGPGEKRDIETMDQGLKEFYIAKKKKYRQLEDLVQYLLASLTEQRIGCLTKYEICSIVYETGLEGFQTLLFRDREGELLATSDPPCLNIAHSGFAILDRTVQSLRREYTRNPPSIAGTTTSTLQTKVTWSYSSDMVGHEDGAPHNPLDQGHTPEQHLPLESMRNIITVTVALLITSPMIVSATIDIIRLIALTNVENPDETIRPYETTKFKAFFRIYTSDFENAGGEKGGYVSTLSKGLMTRDKLLSGPKIAAISGSTRFMDTTVSSRNASARVNALSIRDANERMNEWIFDQKAVIVNCRFYVWTVITSAAILVVGGLAIGFTVRNRIVAVDPFNITTYAWVLAAFLVLICKSVRVETWSWRDFLNFTVQCKSISELHDVTGIPEQLIIAKLLHEERTTILHTRGPYNFAFTRRSDDGFSIDVPLTMWTMLLSGLIMAQVMTPQGYALVCLDVRRGTKYSCVGHQVSSVDAKEKLVCLDPTTSQKRGTGKHHLFSLQKKEIDWMSVQGLFNMPDAEFV